MQVKDKIIPVNYLHLKENKMNLVIISLFYKTKLLKKYSLKVRYIT